MSKTKYIFPITFLFACFLTFIIYLIPNEFNSQILKLIALISILYILFPFLKTNVKWVLYYFFCIDNYWWDKRVQRPRILIYISYFGIFYFAVYDRWGEMVFETKDPSQGWDGNFKGKPSDPGVFGYYVKAKCGEQSEEIFKKGNVTLIR